MVASSRENARSLLRQSNGYFHLLFFTSASLLDSLLLLFGAVAAILAGIPFPILGILFGQLVDDLNSASCDASLPADRSKLQSSIQRKVILMIYISIGNFLAIYVHATCWTAFGERLVGRLRCRYFGHLLRQEMAYFDALPAGEVPTRLTTDMETVRNGTSEKVGIFISSFAYFVGAFIVAFLRAPKLAGMLTFMIPTYILMVMIGNRYVGRYTSRASQQLSSAASVVSQSLYNISLVHALGASKRLETKLVKMLAKTQTAAVKKSGVAATQFGFMFFVAYSANALAFWQGSTVIAQTAERGSSRVTAGAVYTVIFLLLDASLVISQVAPFLQIFGAAASVSQTLMAFVDQELRVRETSVCNNHDMGPLEGPIQFKHVYFAYPTRPECPVLQGISLNVERGRFTAIVGASGSGKSTIAGLVTRLYDASAGSIHLDNRSLADLSMPHLRRSVGIVDQDPQLFSCSILENIAFGIVSHYDQEKYHPALGAKLFRLTETVREGQTLDSALRTSSAIVRQVFEEVREAAIRADAHSFIQNLQYGYASMITPLKDELSGGQAQRIALARALVRDPPILILDEATSALDSASEQKILASLSHVRKGKTTITIAHRLSTIKHADHIIVMEHGRVLEEGTHEELLATGQGYAAMTEAQRLQLSTPVSAEPTEASTTSSFSIGLEKEVKSSRVSLGPIRRLSHLKQRSDQGSPHPGYVGAFRSYAALARPHTLLLTIGLVGSLIAGGSFSGDAVIFGTTIGQLDPCRGSKTIRSAGRLAGLLFFVLAVLAFLGNSSGSLALGRAAEKTVCKIRILTFRSLMQKDPAWHTSEGRSPASLLSHFTTDTSAVAGLSGVVVGTILITLVNLVTSIIMAHIIAWKIAIVLLATLPVLLGSGFMRLYAMAQFSAKHKSLHAVSASISLEAVASIRTIANYSLENEIFKRYRFSLQAPYKASLRAFAYTNFWLATAYSISMLIYSLAYWWGSKQIAAGTYSQTQFFIVLPALLFSAQSCGQMFALVPDVSNARAAATRLFELINSTSAVQLHQDTTCRESTIEGIELDKNTEIDPEKGLTIRETEPTPIELPGMAIEINDVSFSYPNRPGVPVLKNLSLSILPGQFCAFVGPSGAGKSTIFSLLESFYKPTSGSMLLDGRDLSATDSAVHRTSISLVPQANVLFSDSIFFNISLGAHPRHTPTQNEVVDACKQANIQSLIASLPEGYHTQCGANASHFSGGQKQRLCIARALVRRPRLLLMDEPTSALDAEAETTLQETIEGLRGKMTILVVAHRLCTVQKADRIFWIENGRCTHAGTNMELLLKCQGYRESAAHQNVGESRGC